MNYQSLKTFNSRGIKNKTFLWIIAILFFASCSPTIHYLGDSYQETNTIDVFYNEKDVEKEYTTIGKMTHDKMIDYEIEEIKDAMIRKAKQKGGDGIIFTETNVSREGHHEGDRLSISADVIRYKD